MPDGRFVSKKIGQNEHLGSVSAEAALFFTWCIPHLDRDGRMTGNPALMKANVCPLVEAITSETIPGLICELTPLVRWYESDKKAVLAFPGFRGEQKGKSWYDREAESQYPQWDTGALDLVQSWSRASPVQVRPREVQVQGEVQEKASANADEGAPSIEEDENYTWGEVMAVVREELHLGRNDQETERSGSCLKRDFLGKVPAQDVIDACRGTRRLIEEGLVDGAKPGEAVGLRFLRTWKHGNRYLWDAALEAERLGVGLARASPPDSRKRSQPARLNVETPARTA